VAAADGRRVAHAIGWERGRLDARASSSLPAWIVALA
jgi:hypothetical protein